METILRTKNNRTLKASKDYAAEFSTSYSSDMRGKPVFAITGYSAEDKPRARLQFTIEEAKRIVKHFNEGILKLDNPKQNG